MSKFLLDPCSHRQFRPTTRQEQEILKIDGLRDNRQFLVQPFGKLGWSSIQWDKLESCSINSLTAFLDVQMSSVTSSQDYGSSSRPEHYLRSKFLVLSLENFCKQFQRHSNVSRLESDHDMRICDPSQKCIPRD